MTGAVRLPSMGLFGREIDREHGLHTQDIQRSGKTWITDRVPRQQWPMAQGRDRRITRNVSTGKDANIGSA